MQNNNLSPIPFYGSLAEQDFKKWYSYGEHTPLMVSKSYLLPFFFFVPKTTTPISITSMYFYDECGNRKSGSYEGYLKNAMSHYVGDDGVTFFYSKRSSAMSIPKGFYYIVAKVSVGGTTYTFYSELFQVCEDAELARECVSVKWYDAEDVVLSQGVIPFAHAANGTLYYNQLYLPTDVGMPEYSFTEEGEDRDGRFFPTKQISEKVYKMSFAATECMCDCLRLACMGDVVLLEDRLGRDYDAEHFEMEVTWLQGGFFADVECTFETNTVVKKVGKDYGTITSR